MKKQPTRDKLLDITFEEVYIYGYASTSIDAILKKAKIPKGSMYYHFKSKKELVLAMIEERLFVNMDNFFIYEKKNGQTVIQSIRSTFASIAKNNNLITHGCPLYRLMVELSPTDNDFDTLLSNKANEMKENISALLLKGIKDKELSSKLNTKAFASFILSTVWGILSLSPSISSSKIFLEQIKYVIEHLESYKID